MSSCNLSVADLDTSALLFNPSALLDTPGIAAAAPWDAWLTDGYDLACAAYYRRSTAQAHSLNLVGHAGLVAATGYLGSTSGWRVVQDACSTIATQIAPACVNDAAAFVLTGMSLAMYPVGTSLSYVGMLGVELGVRRVGRFTLPPVAERLAGVAVYMAALALGRACGG